MLKINSSLKIELEKGGQKISIDIDEARQIIKDLGKFVQDGGYGKKSSSQARIQKKTKQSRKMQRTKKSSTSKVLHMSDTKRKQIINNVNKRLSTKPKTLSNLLNGVSYVPNFLPSIRVMVEKQTNVAKKGIGKRTYYFKKKK